jgi:hypothetical protein
MRQRADLPKWGAARDIARVRRAWKGDQEALRELEADSPGLWAQAKDLTGRGKVAQLTALVVIWYGLDPQKFEEWKRRGPKYRYGADLKNPCI